MEKRISYSDFQSVKRVAQACNPLYVEREKIRAKIEKLAAEFKDKDTQISALEAGIVKTFGFRVEQLVVKVIEPGVDVHGNPKKTTKYLPTSIVSYDEQNKQYVINDGNEETSEAPTPTEEAPVAETPVEEPVNQPVEEEVEIFA